MSDCRGSAELLAQGGEEASYRWLLPTLLLCVFLLPQMQRRGYIMRSLHGHLSHSAAARPVRLHDITAHEAALRRLAVAGLVHHRLGAWPLRGKLRHLDVDVVAMVGACVVGRRPYFGRAPPGVSLAEGGAVATHLHQGKLLTTVCQHPTMRYGGLFRARFTVISSSGYLAVGVLRMGSRGGEVVLVRHGRDEVGGPVPPRIYRSGEGWRSDTSEGWSWCAQSGHLRNQTYHSWKGQAGFGAGDEVELELNLAQQRERTLLLDDNSGTTAATATGGTLTAFLNGERLGVLSEGLPLGEAAPGTDSVFQFMLETGNKGTTVRVG